MVEFTRQQPSDFPRIRPYRKIERKTRLTRSRSQHFKDMVPEPTEYLLRCAFPASSLSVESGWRFTRLAVEQTGLYPIYLLGKISGESAKPVYSTAGQLTM